MMEVRQSQSASPTCRMMTTKVALNLVRSAQRPSTNAMITMQAMPYLMEVAQVSIIIASMRLEAGARWAAGPTPAQTNGKDSGVVAATVVVVAGLHLDSMKEFPRTGRIRVDLGAKVVIITITRGLATTTRAVECGISAVEMVEIRTMVAATIITIISRASIREEGTALTTITITRATTMAITGRVAIVAVVATKAAAIAVVVRTLTTRPRSVVLHPSPVVSTRLLRQVVRTVATMQGLVIIAASSRICKTLLSRSSK